MNDGDKDKKSKRRKKSMSYNRNLSLWKLFRSYSAWEQNKPTRKIKVVMDSFRQDHKKFIKKPKIDIKITAKI